MTYFSELGLTKAVVKAADGAGYKTPTPIQAKAIPVALTGQDVLGIAQTGTGKTAAFTLPLIDMLLREGRKAAPNTCRALILAPTRELAGQIYKTVITLVRKTPLQATQISGGMRMNAQKGALMQGQDIVVATPGRLEDHINRGNLSLDATSFVVLDEADHMLDIGFLPAIKRIHGALAEGRQTLMFTATMPKAIRSLAAELLAAPREIAVAAESKPVDRIDQQVIPVKVGGKSSVLQEVLGKAEAERTVVFIRTKRAADRIAKNLNAAGFTADSIHGDRNQGQRNRALNDFRSGKVAVLVATDIAARGIDIPDVSHVINYDLPQVPEAYVHRIGRTARAGRSGVAIALMDPSERGLLRSIEKTIGQKLLDDGDDSGADHGDTGPANRRPWRSKKPRRPQGQNKGQNRGQNKARPKGHTGGRKTADGGSAKPGRPGGRKGKGRPNARAA